jgi:hypothetical protein
MKYQDFFLATEWKKEILTRSRIWTDIFLIFLGVVLIIFLLMVAGLNVFFPKDGSSLQIFQKITIDSKTKNILSAAASAIGILFSMSIIPPIKKWYTPKKLNYRAAAAGIIDELKEKGTISKDQHQDLLNITDKNLGALESAESKADTEEMLMRACTEMAKVLEGS